MVIDGGFPECVKCKSQTTVDYIDGRRVCCQCGCDQVEHSRKTMIKNLRTYGFVEVKNFEKPNIFQKTFNIKTKQLESHYKYRHVIAKHVPDSSNMKLIMGTEETNFHFYGSFKFVKSTLDRIINDKTLLRKLKLEKLNNV